MTLDDVAARYKTASGSPVVRKLGDLLLDWKRNDLTVVELDRQVERYLGISWIEDENEFNDVLHTWRGFRAETIDQIGGMTMNERLYFLSLFERFDAATSDSEKAVVYHKVLARP